MTHKFLLQINATKGKRLELKFKPFSFESLLVLRAAIEPAIGFTYGSGGSGYSGDMWHFRIAKQTVKIWKDKDEWGSSGDDYVMPKKS